MCACATSLSTMLSLSAALIAHRRRETPLPPRPLRWSASSGFCYKRCRMVERVSMLLNRLEGGVGPVSSVGGKDCIECNRGR